MPHFNLYTKDSFTNNTERVDLIFSSISKELMEELISKFDEEQWNRENYIGRGVIAFIEYLQEKGINAKLIPTEDLIFSEYDSS